MAAAFLNRSQAVIWLPPRGIGERAFATEARLLVAIPGQKSADPQQGHYRRSSLEALPKMRSAILVYDARDVTLIRAQLPSLPAARLLKAVPNVVEDALLQDVSTCAFALGPPQEGGLRQVAVIDRAWLEFTIGAFERRGIRISEAWPAQLILPIVEGGWSMACVNDGLAVRTGELEGIGWAAASDPPARIDSISSAMRSVSADVTREGRSVGPLTAFAEDSAWLMPIEQAGRRCGQTLKAARLPLPRNSPVDLLDGRAGSRQQRWFARIDWRSWRWPAAIATACVLVSLLGLNLHWGRLVQERNQLMVLKERKFLQTFPNAQVVVDPMLQMQRQVSALRASTGQSGPDDFVPLVVRLSRALETRGPDAVAGVEYRDGRLKVRFQPAFVGSATVRDGLREAFRQQGLVLRFDNDSDPLATVSLST